MCLKIMATKTKKSVKNKKAGSRTKKLSKDSNKTKSKSKEKSIFVDKPIFDEDSDLDIKPAEIDPDQLDFEDEDEDELEIDSETEETELDEIDPKRKTSKKNKAIFRDSSISWYLEQINKIPLLNREEENRLAKAAKAGNEEAKDNLIKANLRFVVTIAKKYQTSGISLLDLINEGNMGLIKAAEKFDPDRGYHFISYAIWWIRQAIILAISQKTSLIRLPVNRTVDIQKIEKVHRKLENQLGREPTAAEISAELDMDDDEVDYLRSISQEYVSLDSSLGDSEEMSVLSTMEDFGTESPDKKVLDESLKDALNLVLETLTESERDILKMRFGLNGKKPMSLQQIGDKFNLSKERIRQIEKKAIRRLRHPSRIQQLKTFFGR
jgi:RNA polymerase primary sigma factor